MPIYEYQCNVCGTVTEVIVTNGNSADKVTCSSCGAEDMRKKLSVTTLPTFPSPRGGMTCCGRDETCGSSSCCGG